MYKEFIKEKKFDGTLTDLIKEIVGAFANEKIGQPGKPSKIDKLRLTCKPRLTKSFILPGLLIG